ncbi:hypothetical protein DH2020_037829 [Rehmannia glutinosa]|uniref:VHS domain-containing protein n=1 Tax=Rehmannia glutinosa TaxID=99300 RepID=A0ABR0V0C3_REHGL
MEQSRRAVESYWSYWRSRMIDGATSDEDKVTPVYKLEEICDLLRSSHVSIVKEVSEFILKRLEHKSPIVKQKALRVIKYAVGKSGAEFKRRCKEILLLSSETLSILFSSDDSKAAATERSFHSRIQGFGNTNYEMPSEDKKSFMNEVVDIGSATIIQGLSSLKQTPSLKKSNDIGSYKSPNLRRSLTMESDYSDRYEGIGSHAETQNSSCFSKNAGSGSWGPNVSTSQSETSNGDSGSTYGQKSREEKLLETIVTSGGVRLQPTRDALHVFLVEASKLNALSLGHAIETKLKSPSWQVRMKAVCILEAVLRKKEGGHFSHVASYFGDNKDVLVQCAESPQASLREKATKVLSLLGGEQIGGVNHDAKSMKNSQPSTMPDLIDTGDRDDYLPVEDLKKTVSEPKITNAAASTAPLINDLLGDDFGDGESTNGQKFDDDPFADVSFHISQVTDHVADLFSGLAVDKSTATEAHSVTHRTESEPINLLDSSSEVFKNGLFINENDPFMKKTGSNAEKDSDNGGSSDFASQAAGTNANPMFPLGSMAYNFPSGLMYNPAFVSQPMNYSDMGSLFAQQQQFLATMSNFHQLGNLQSNYSINAAGSEKGNSSALPDIFNPRIDTEPPTSMMNGSKRESKAFDFISDHLVSARDPKRVI